MSFDPVRIGVIGTGRFGILHAKTLLGLAESELVALVDCSEKALSELPEEFSGIPKYSAPEDALRKSSAEAWVVSTSTADHVQVASMLLEQDGHVLLEKPISGNLQEALKLSPRVSQTQGKLMLGHILLFNSEFRALQSECH
ncbi:MAG: Gfo/Idh/MocA family oxidoreductase, partial [SAR324 cluster bacterium]|nr:Gfo/Idh/MocA family oxidoreductase [SAR324 cluster bacterium]